MTRRILIACPDLGSGAGYSTALSRVGFKVEVVTTGMDCLARARAWHPDLMVVFSDLPWGTAAGVLAVMYEDRDPDPIPTLVLTDDPTRTWVDLQSGWGCQMVQTPVTPDDLCRIVRDLPIARGQPPYRQSGCASESGQK